MLASSCHSVFASGEAVDATGLVHLLRKLRTALPRKLVSEDELATHMEPLAQVLSSCHLVLLTRTLRGRLKSLVTVIR